MPASPFQALACPLDGQPLTLGDTAWRCAAGHSFDSARQGYVNLLPVQQKRSQDPGDSKAMVAARQRFLQAGYYQPLTERICRQLMERTDQSSGEDVFSCLDAGCGEGYYLRQLASRVPVDLALIGLDISKWAVMAAARQDNKHLPFSRWVVGSNAHLPVQPAALDCVLCMFGFPVYREFARVLKSGGVLLQVEAGPQHLRELREVIYPQLKPERSAALEAPEGFTYLGEETLSYPIRLEGQETIADLLAMTPHLYRASAEGRARAAALDQLALTVDVRLIQWERS